MVKEVNLVKIVNVETNEEIVREMNADESEWFSTYKMESEKKLEFDSPEEVEKRKIAKSALLGKLGITEEEAKLLLS